MAITSAGLMMLDAETASRFPDLAAQGQPLVVTGAMEQWPALRLWDYAYLRDAEVKNGSPLPVFHASRRGMPMRPLEQWLPLSEIVERLWNTRPADPFPEGSLFYAKQRGLQDFPGLLRDVRRPLFYPDHLVEVNLWLGGAGCSSPLHFDYVDNLMCQVRGERRVLLYAPGQGRALYPAYALREPTDESTPPHFSLVGNPHTADPAAFPRFADVRPAHDLRLGPGEMLYIPPYWWHHVEITDGPAVQVNFWYSLQYGALMTADDHRAETEVMEHLRVLLDRASPARRSGLGAVITSLCEATGQHPV
ncbi:MAG TPA: cupin-like domain-containing protein [Vicinamibacterales bacterium]|jgi:hypothetical protein